MKSLAGLFIVVTVLFASQLTFSSCTKTEVKTDTVTITKTVTDTIVSHVITYPVSNLLLGKQWIVDSLFHNYNGSNSGTLVYKRGGSNNTQDLDKYINIMWPDGTQLFFNGDSYAVFTYSFLNSDSTQILFHNPGNDYARIVDLTENHLTIFDSTNSALSYYEYKR